MSKLVKNISLDQIPGKLEISLNFDLPDENFDSVTIHRRIDKYCINPNDLQADLIHTEAFELDKLNRQIFIKDNTDINPGNIYYYTIITNIGLNYYYSSVTQRYIPVTQIIGLENKLYEIQPDNLLKEDTETNDLKKMIKVLAQIIEYIHGKTNAMEIFFNPDKMPPEIFQNMAKQMGWYLDPNLSIDIQRQIVSNITYFYQWTGTFGGIDKLAKFYSGYPDRTGIIEGSSKLIFSPKISDSSVDFEEKTTIDFRPVEEGGDDLSLIGTPNDPLYYCYDFSDTSRFNLSQTFTIYFQKPDDMQQSEVDRIKSILDNVLIDNVPVGVNYDIIAY